MRGEANWTLGLFGQFLSPPMREGTAVPPRKRAHWEPVAVEQSGTRSGVRPSTPEPMRVERLRQADHGQYSLERDRMPRRLGGPMRERTIKGLSRQSPGPNRRDQSPADLGTPARMTRELDTAGPKGKEGSSRDRSPQSVASRHPSGGKCGPTVCAKRMRGTWKPASPTPSGRWRGGCSLVSEAGRMTQEANTLGCRNSSAARRPNRRDTPTCVTRNWSIDGQVGVKTS